MTTTTLDHLIDGKRQAGVGEKDLRTNINPATGLNDHLRFRQKRGRQRRPLLSATRLRVAGSNHRNKR